MRRVVRSRLGRTPLSPAEVRAVAVAAMRYPVGSDQYEGAKVGFLVATAGSDRPLTRPLHPSVEWLDGFWVGHDVGQLSARADSRKEASA